MDFDELLEEEIFDKNFEIDYNDEYIKELFNFEIEDERSNSHYDRSTFINKELIFSIKYIEAIKSLGESRYCSKRILNSARKMLCHHHGDKYEDLYFIDCNTNKVLSRTDYKVREQEVLPTKVMIQFVKDNPNIISLHNHPTSTLPSPRDILTCFCVGYKYGLVMCHNGSIYQYSTPNENINEVIYDMETKIFEKREENNRNDYKLEIIIYNQFVENHHKNFQDLYNRLLNAGVFIKEVLWNDNP